MLLRESRPARYAVAMPKLFKDKLKNKKKIFLPLFLAAAGTAVLGLGAFMGVRSWEGRIYVSLRPPSEGRKIASSDPAEEILSLSLEEIGLKAREKLFGVSQINETDSQLRFHLGNFLVRSPFDESPQLVCQAYSFLEMTFTARGVNLSGDSGMMLVQSPCRQKDKTMIGPFWIPKKDILDNPGRSSFSLPEEETLIRFYNAAIALTPRWLLTDARFFNSPEEDGFIVQFAPGRESPAFELEMN